MELPASVSRQRLRLDYLDPATLAPHPHNPKIHDAAQLDTIGDLMGSVGWAGALLFNEQTGRLLDGHGRRELALKTGEPVPVLIGSWSDAEERQIVALLDASGWMAKVDRGLLNQLTEGGQLLAQAGPRLAELLLAVEDASELLVSAATNHDGGGGADSQAPDSPDPAGTLDSGAVVVPRPAAAETPDALWPSADPFGVPLLLPELQADCVEFPFTLWGTQGQAKAMRGTWHFYTHDEAFAHLWSNPGKVYPSGAPVLCEPNFSTHDQTPLIVSLHGIYKRRWLSRYWQSQGRRIFADCNLHHSLLEPCEAIGGAVPAFLGLAPGWKAFSTRAHGNRPEMLEAEHDACSRFAGTASLMFVVYGGGQKVKELAAARGWNWFPEHNETRKADIHAS